MLYKMLLQTCFSNLLETGDTYPQLPRTTAGHSTRTTSPKGRISLTSSHLMREMVNLKKGINPTCG